MKPVLAAAVGVRAMLARGCRPRVLAIELSSWNPWGVVDRADYVPFGLSILAEFAAAAAPPPTELSLQELPLTAEVVRALAAAVPCPRALTLTGYDLLLQCGGVGSEGAQDLLHHAAPHLQQLALQQLMAAAGGGDTQSALHGSLASLQLCTRLASLTLDTPVGMIEDLTVLPALAQLPALRSLTLVGDYFKGPAWRHTALSSLSRLTHLCTQSDVDVMLPAVTHLHGLVELELMYAELQPSHLQQLAALTALTRLRVSRLEAAAPEPGAGAVLGGAGTSSTQEQPGGPAGLQLPPRLQLLSFREAVDVHMLARLQLPDCLTALEMRGLLVLDDALDGRGFLTPAAAKALLAACGQLAGRWNAAAGFLNLELGSAKPPIGCSGAPLFAALQPVALKQLRLFCGPLTVRDVDALVRHLPALEALDFRCALELAALPSLRRLDRLHTLVVDVCKVVRHRRLAEAWKSTAALGAALLTLCAEAPSLESVQLDVFEAPASMQEAAEEAEWWVRERLPHLRSNPPMVYVCSPNGSYPVSGEDGSGSGDGSSSSWEEPSSGGEAATGSSSGEEEVGSGGGEQIGSDDSSDEED